MFGYVKPLVSDLLVKEYEFYKATYCGICRSMKKHTGKLSNITITYDSVFLALIRMAYIDDSELGSKMRRCIAHPLKRRCMLNDNSAIEYTARAFAILTYYKMQDDLTDEKLLRRMFVSLLRPLMSGAKKRARLTQLAAVAAGRLAAITEIEKSGVASVDEPAQLFGELLGEIFAGGLDGEARLVTYQCGYHLGKFIYAADAAEDYERDRASGSYNPYVLLYNRQPLTAENRQTVKCALLLECKKLESAINLIPFGNKITVENIVRNIIYLGLVKRIEFLDEGEELEEK